MNTYTVTLEQATQITLMILAHNAQDAVHQARVTLNADHLHEHPGTPLALSTANYTFTEHQEPDIRVQEDTLPFLRFQGAAHTSQMDETVYLPVNELLSVWDVVRVLPHSTLRAEFTVQGCVMHSQLDDTLLCSNHPEVVIATGSLPVPERIQFHASRDDFWLSFLTRRGWCDTTHITWASIQHLEHDILQLDPTQSSNLQVYQVTLHCNATRQILVAAHSEQEALLRARSRPVVHPAPFVPTVEPSYSVRPTPGLHTYLGLYVNGPKSLDKKDQQLAIIPMSEVLSCFETIKPLPERLQSLEMVVQSGLVDLGALQENPSCPEAAHLAILCSEVPLLDAQDTGRCLMTHDSFRLYFSKRQVRQASPRQLNKDLDTQQTLITFDVPWNDVETAMSDIRTVNYHMHVEH